MRILFTGGGTGGHFFPIIAVARELKRLAEAEMILDLELYYMGSLDLGADELKKEGIISLPVLTGKVRRYFSGQNFLDMVKLGLGTMQALFKMFLIMPDVIFSKGGYGALPTILAGLVFRIPLVIHESDSVPGQVSLFSGRFADRVGLAFDSAAAFFKKGKVALVGIPLRKKILGGVRAEARQNIGLKSDLPAVAFIGASQGSQRLNETVLGVLAELTTEFEVLHQTGLHNFTEVQGEAKVILEAKGNSEHYHVFNFLAEEQMRDFYAAADLIVSRAGASSIFEIAACAKPSILIPLPEAAQDHQRQNAYEYSHLGAAVIMEEINLTPHLLLDEIRKVMSNPDLLKRMQETAQRFARLDSAEVVGRELLKLGIH